MMDPHRGIRGKRYDPPCRTRKRVVWCCCGRQGYGAVSFCGILLSTEHVVGPLLVTDHVVGVVGCGVLRWFVRLDAGRHGGHRPVANALAEKGEGVPLA